MYLIMHCVGHRLSSALCNLLNLCVIMWCQQHNVRALPIAFIYNHGESPSDCGGLKTKEPSDDVGVVIACVASVITPGFRSWFSEHCQEFAFVFIDEIHEIYSDLYGPLHNAVATLIPRPDMRFVLAS